MMIGGLFGFSMSLAKSMSLTFPGALEAVLAAASMCWGAPDDAAAAETATSEVGKASMELLEEGERETKP